MSQAISKESSLELSRDMSDGQTYGRLVLALGIKTEKWLPAKALFKFQHKKRKESYMIIEFIALEYTPTPKRIIGKVVKVNEYNDFKSEYITFDKQFKNLSKSKEFSRVIEAKVQNNRSSDESVVARWRRQIVSELFLKDLFQKEKIYA
jgi:hypothetical protein